MNYRTLTVELGCRVVFLAVWMNAAILEVHAVIVNFDNLSASPLGTTVAGNTFPGVTFQSGIMDPILVGVGDTFTFSFETDDMTIYGNSDSISEPNFASATFVSGRKDMLMTFTQPVTSVQLTTDDALESGDLVRLLALSRIGNSDAYRVEALDHGMDDATQSPANRLSVGHSTPFSHAVFQIIGDFEGFDDLTFGQKPILWSQRVVADQGENITSNFNWENILRPVSQQFDSDVLVADDFRDESGGAVTCVRWWGSYQSASDQPRIDTNGTGAYQPVVEEAFVISFFSDRGEPGELLGTYIAPQVQIQPTGLIGWDGHPIWEYQVRLEDTFLDHSNPDYTSPSAFQGRRGEDYWISIAAENGYVVDPVTGATHENGDPLLDVPFWGWHTSPQEWDNAALQGRIEMAGTDWIYQEWNSQITHHGPASMAFELLGEIANLRCDLNSDGSVDAADAGILFANWGMSGAGDVNGDGVVDAADAGICFGEWTADPQAVPEPAVLPLIVLLGFVLGAARKHGSLSPRNGRRPT